jgi:hypothetical protein
MNHPDCQKLARLTVSRASIPSAMAAARAGGSYGRPAMDAARIVNAAELCAGLGRKQAKE